MALDKDVVTIPGNTTCIMAVFSEEDVNYMRLQRLVNKSGTAAVREYFDNSPNFTPAVLQATLTRKQYYLQTLKTRNILNASQWDILFPPGGAVPTSNQFDLTLLVLLLRNYGALGEPRHFKWDQLPLPTEVAIYHDVARLKHYRNKYAHATSGVSQADFLKDWKDIEDAILRIVPPAKQAQFTSEISKLKTTPLNQEDLVRLLNQIQNESSRYTVEIKDKISTEIRKLQSLTLKNTKTIIAETKATTRQLEKKIDTLAKQNHDEMIKQTATFRTDLNKTSEKQKEYTQNMMEQQTATFRTNLTKTSEIQRGYTQNVITQQTATFQNLINETSENQVKQIQNMTDQQTAVLIQKVEEIAKRNETSTSGGDSTGILHAFSRKLKTVYKERFSKVNSVSSDGVPTMFDVTSKLYMDLDCTPLEMRCMDVHNRTDKEEDKSRKRQHRQDLVGKNTSPKRLKGQTDVFLNKCDKEGKMNTILDPVPSTSSEYEIAECSHEDSRVSPPLQVRGSPRVKNEKLKITEKDKPTTTAQISRLFTTDVNPDKLPILIEADAGVGKTTLFHRLALDWANETKEMEQFKLVFLIPLRRVKSKKIEDIICDDLQLLPSEFKTVLKGCLSLWRDQILYLLDGLDEVKLGADNELRKSLEERGRHVFCSSRPILQDRKEKENYHGMEKYLLVKLLGFSDQTLVKYINQYFQEVSDKEDINAERVIAECSKHFYCRALIKIPLYAGLLCYLWEKCQDEFPDTATQLFNRFLIEVLTNYLFRHTDPTDKCNNKLHIIGSEKKASFIKSPMEKTVPPQIRRMVISISKLAYTTLMEHKVIFTVEDADENDLSLEDLTHIGLFSIEDDGEVIYFRHKLFHEYLAGLYLTLPSHGVQVYSHFNECREEIINRRHILQNAFFFAAGLCQETYKRILFGLNYSFHNEDNDFFLYSNVEKHDYDINEIGDCDKCYKMSIAMQYNESAEGKHTSLEYDTETDLPELSFFVQLAFENHESITDRQIVSRLPVHCSSAHSLAAAMYVLQTDQRNESTSIVLIGGSVIDIDQLLCILNECSNNENIKCITLLKADEDLIREVLNMEWKYVEKLGFEECEIVVPIHDVIWSFPNVKKMFIDASTWKSGKIFTGRENEGATPQHVKVIVTDCTIKDEELEKEQEFEKHVDSLRPCYVISSDCVHRIFSLLVEKYGDWPQREREKCIPGSVIKGICYCCFDGYYDDSLVTKITGAVNPYGLQWEHAVDSGRCDDDDDMRPDVLLRTPERGPDTLSVLSVKNNQTEYCDEILEMYRHVIVWFEESHLCIHKTVIQFMYELLQKEWTDVDVIIFTECEFIVPVDILAKTFPDLIEVRYDKETLRNGRPFTQIYNTWETSETTDNLLVCFTGIYDVIYGYDIQVSCRSCYDRNSRYIQVALKEYESLDFSERKCYFYCLGNVKGLCLENRFTIHPAIKHLEFIHTNDMSAIVDVHRQNPDLKEVVLDLTHDLQECLSEVKSGLSILESGVQQWKCELIFGCKCPFRISPQRGRYTTYISKSVLKPLEVTNDKVKAWNCKNYDVLSVHERFVLHHHMLHNATEIEKEQYKSITLSKEMIMSWMDYINLTEFDEIETNGTYSVEVVYFEEPKTSAKFTKEELWEGFKDNLPRWAQLLYH